MKTTFRHICMVVCMALILVLNSCGGGGSGNNTTSGSGTSAASISGNAPVVSKLSLVADSVAPVPLITTKKGILNSMILSNASVSGTQPTTYAVGIKNIGSKTILGLTFSLASGVNVQQSAASLSQSINGSSCLVLLPGGSCRVIITTTKAGSSEIIGTDLLAAGKVANSATAAIGNQVIKFLTSVYPLTVAISTNQSNALTLAQFPNTLVLEPNGTGNNYFGALSLSVINTYTAPIDVTNLFKNLPSYVSWSMISCPNPLPSGMACQVRLMYSGPIGSNVTVNLNPGGKIVNTNGSKTTLPLQSSNGILIITKNAIASLNVSYPSLVLSESTPNTNNVVNGYIENTGTAPAAITSITINNSVFSISNNQCIGQLAANAICQYTITANVNGLANLASGSYTNMITVNYNNGSVATGQLSYSYTAVIQPANLSIVLSGVSSLNNITTSGTLTVTNTSNVALSNISMPTILSGSTAAGVTISDPNNCNGQTIMPESGCSFMVNFVPTGYNENAVASIGGITANYINPINQVSTSVSFPNTYQINITTGSQAVLTFNPASPTADLNWTNSTTFSRDLTITNSGGFAISNLSFAVAAQGVNSILTVSPASIQGLAAGATSTITINGDYANNQPTSYTSTGTIIAVATDSLGNTYPATAITLNATVQMMPVVTPGLSINGVIPSSMYRGAANAQTVLLTLTNNTSATNNGNTAIAIDLSSLTNGIGTGLIGSLNTTGISNNACDISGAQITLGNNQSCNVNLVLTATLVGVSTVAITPTYEYYVYSSTSTTPTLTPVGAAQLSTIGGAITVSAMVASLNAAFYDSAGFPITSLSTEVGINTTALLQITNTGNKALTGITLPTVSGLTFTPDSSCNTLAPGATCNVSVALYSTTVLASTNLNSNSINYTYTNDLGNQTGTTSLPSLAYQVTAPASPSISASTSFVNCSGNITDTAQQCNLNPTSSGVGGAGSAGAYEFVVTYSNSGSGAADITVVPAIIGNYSIAANNCNGIELAAATGTCTVVYDLTAPTAVGVTDIPNNASLGTYSYTYGSQNQIAVSSINVYNPNFVSVNVTEPFLSLAIVAVSGSSATVSALLSSWYALNIPSSLAIRGGAAAGMSTGLATVPCLANASGCSGSVTVTGLTTGTIYHIDSSITAPDGSTIFSPVVVFTTLAAAK